MEETIRQKKVGRLVQKELSEILQLTNREIVQQEFVSVTAVRMSRDMSIAKAYISMTLTKDKQAILKRLDMHKKEIRKILGYKIRRQVRVTPQLIFFIDEVEESAIRIEALIKKLHIPPA